LSYEKIAERIKKDLDTELGITFSLGLAPTKVLAKIASKWRKPSGFTVVPGRDIHLFLDNLPVQKIWGVGPQTSAYLNKLDVYTALQYASKEKDWVERNLTKPHIDIWRELRGELVNKVNAEVKHHYQSISKTKTFSPPSKDSEFIFSQLSKNIENACIKLRRHKLSAKKIFFFLKSQDFRYFGTEVEFNLATDTAVDIVRACKKIFPNVFDRRRDYRATGIILLDLRENNTVQMDLFSNNLLIQKISRLFGSIDDLAEKYGKHTLFLGSSFKAMVGKHHDDNRQKMAGRKSDLFKGETFRKRIGIPFCGEII
jgi:DNA polymerase-4/DNA polymerase V